MPEPPGGLPPTGTAPHSRAKLTSTFFAGKYPVAVGDHDERTRGRLSGCTGGSEAAQVLRQSEPTTPKIGKTERQELPAVVLLDLTRVRDLGT